MQSISLQQQQKLQARLSPEQIQVVKMLELPAMELQQRVNEELQENPALEEGKDPVEEEEKRQEEIDLYGEEEDYSNPLQNEDFNYDTYVEDDEIPEYKLRTNNYSPDDEVHETPLTGGTSFMEYLKSQVYLTHMNKAERHIAKFVVGNIDEDGYLRRTAEELEDDLAFRESLVVPHEQMVDIIKQIKQFDPPGLGAYDLKECLLLQLHQREATPVVQLAIQILTEQFDAFSRRHFERIRLKYNLSEEEMREVINEIEHLNPTPGAEWAGTSFEIQGATVIPDFLVENRDGEIVMQLLDGEIPDLHVSTDYQQMMKDYAGRRNKLTDAEKETVQFVKSKIDSAKWFIDAIKQRNETLTRTMLAIIEEQKEFFYEGDDSALKPMILQDIANKTGYDVSTISRVSNSKYVQTEFGVFPLKHFFSEGMQNIEGDEVSTREIKQVLKEIIDREDKAHPLNDDELVLAMKQAGYPIARRTVSKYRQQMGKTIARLRKQL